MSSGVVPLRKEADGEAEQMNELRFGDLFTAYEEKDGWAYGQSGRDHYVGYVQAGALSKKLFTPTHRIAAPFTFLFPEPSIKSPPVDRITYLSAAEVKEEREHFLELKSGGFVHREHVRPIGEWDEGDPVAVAERLLRVPYLWGGVTPLGCDCSGLVQLALEACGLKCPRDSDMQAEGVGSPVLPSEAQRGDIVCFKGHIGFMADDRNLLHANAFHGGVTRDALSEVIIRAGPITAVRRLR